MKKFGIWKLLLTLNITFASCQIYWVFKEAKIQAIRLNLSYTQPRKRKESKSEREKETAGFACQQDLEFKGGKTMHYEFEILRVKLVSGEMREWECFFFFFLLLLHWSDLLPILFLLRVLSFFLDLIITSYRCIGQNSLEKLKQKETVWTSKTGHDS